MTKLLTPCLTPAHMYKKVKGKLDFLLTCLADNHMKYLTSL